MLKKVNSRTKLNRRQQRDLDIEIGFLERVIQRDPRYVEALQALGADYTNRGKFDHGLEIDKQLSQLRPDDPMVLYNLACSYSLTKQMEPAAAALSQAIDHGYKDFKWLLKDPDLQNLRKHSLFKKLRAKMRAAGSRTR